MHIIVVADHRSAPRSFTVGAWQIVAIGLLGLCGLGGLVLGASVLLREPYPAGNLAARAGMPAVSDVGPTLSMMAGRLGEMEAQLLRLDTFSERLSNLLTARGGHPVPAPGTPASSAPAPAPVTGQPHASAPSLDTLRTKLAEVAAAIQERSTRLNQLESAVVDARATARTLPTIAPIANGPHSSDFGSRVDPFNGEARFHEGIDFPAAVGTPFTAAASSGPLRPVFTSTEISGCAERISTAFFDRSSAMRTL